MRVFVTGATGFIGSAVVKELIGAGHTVIGLTRSAAGAQALRAAGAEPHAGSLTDFDSLRRGAARADGVIHLAFIHGLGDVSLSARLRVFLGGMPSGIVGRFGSLITRTDREAIDALAGALEGSGRPLVTTFGTMGLAEGRLGQETDEPDPRSPGAIRSATEAVVRRWAMRGVRASIIRLAPSVHGDGDSGLVPRLIGVARKTGASSYVEAGRNRWAGVHRGDAAALFRLALERGVAGSRYHGVADEGVAFCDIAEVIGRRLGVPAVSRSPEAAKRVFSWLAPFVAYDNPASSRITQEELGWRPQGSSLLADLDRADYFKA